MYNKLLSPFEENKEPCKRMMKSLENKLRKQNLLERFNENVTDLMKRGVVQWVDEIPQINEMQQSYIPLTYTLKSDPEVTTKLRICGNLSFKTNKSIYLNGRMIPGPQYLNCIEGKLLRWRIKWLMLTSDIVTTKIGVWRRI